MNKGRCFTGFGTLESLEGRRLLSGQTWGQIDGLSAFGPAWAGPGADPAGSHGGGCFCGGCGAISFYEAGLHRGLPRQPDVPQHLLDAGRFRDDGSLLDVDGNQIYFCPAPPALAFAPEPLIDWARAVEYADGYDAGFETYPASYDGTIYPTSGLTAPAFSSLPGAPHTIYLDFTGHVVTGTPWNNFNSGRPIHARPFDLDGDFTSFNAEERRRIEEVYLRVAEDFAPFNVNVTTVDPGEAAFRAGGQALRVLISDDVDNASMGGTGNRWYSNAGGVAYLNSWTWTSDTPVWVFTHLLSNHAKFVAEAASHEVGHGFGLRHDGTWNDAYYRGHGSGAMSWAPIMGVGYSRQITQWSRGEYANANNFEDDLAIITNSRNGITYRDTRHGFDTGSATTLAPVSSSGSVLSFTSENNLIVHQADHDWFRLDLRQGAGRLSAAALPFGYAEGIANLNTRLRLYDGGGRQLADVSPSNTTASEIQRDLSAGVYFLRVSSGSFGDPLATGFTRYGSIGQYDLLADFEFTTPPPPPQTGTFALQIGNQTRTFAASQFTSYSDRDRGGNLSIASDGVLTLGGSVSRKLDLPYTVTPTTVLQLDVAELRRGQRFSIGFEENNTHVDNNAPAQRLFVLGGDNPSWGRGLQPFVGSVGGPAFRTVTVPVGQFYNGPMNHLVFDSWGSSEANLGGDYRVRNVRITEGSPTPTWGFRETGGLVTVEAEKPKVLAAGTGNLAGHRWSVVSRAGASGHALFAGPDTGGISQDNLTGPRADYPILFETPGVYHVWANIYGIRSGNSVHVGLNGQSATLGAKGMTTVNNERWEWTNRVTGRPGGEVVTVTVPSAGVHTLNLWMRQDGATVDKFVLARDPGFRPAGAGPAESPHVRLPGSVTVTGDRSDDVFGGAPLVGSLAVPAGGKSGFADGAGGDDDDDSLYHLVGDVLVA